MGGMYDINKKQLCNFNNKNFLTLDPKIQDKIRNNDIST